MRHDRIKAIAGIFITLILTGLSISAGAADLKKLYYASVKQEKKNIVTAYKEECGVYSPDSLEKVNYNGLLAWEECDLDGDGATEILDISIKEDDLGNNNMLTATVYALVDRENGNRVFSPRGSCVLTNNLMLHDQVNCSVFLLERNGKNYVCCENKEEANILFSDSYWELKVFQYKEEGLQECHDLLINKKSGNRELKSIKKTIEKLGIPTQLLVTEAIIDQNTEGAKKICRIRRGSTKSNEEILNYMNHGDGQIFYYGETIFKSYVNDESENSISSEFSSKKVFTGFNSNASSSQSQTQDSSQNATQNSEQSGGLNPNLLLELQQMKGLFQKKEDDNSNVNSDPENPYGITIYSEAATSEPGTVQTYTDPYTGSYAGYEAEYILPESAIRYLNDNDLCNLSKEKLRLARNEIYARHGRIFGDAELSNYFNSKSWYRGTVPASAFTYEYAKKVFNDYEITNIDLIQVYESYKQ